MSCKVFAFGIFCRWVFKLNSENKEIIKKPLRQMCPSMIEANEFNSELKRSTMISLKDNTSPNWLIQLVK